MGQKKVKKKPTIAILTGGGDVPGLNPCIKALVYRAASEGIRVLGSDADGPVSWNIIPLILKLPVTISRNLSPQRSGPLTAQGGPISTRREQIRAL